MSMLLSRCSFRLCPKDSVRETVKASLNMSNPLRPSGRSGFDIETEHIILRCASDNGASALSG